MPVRKKSSLKRDNYRTKRANKHRRLSFTEGKGGQKKQKKKTRNHKK